MTLLTPSKSRSPRRFLLTLALVLTAAACSMTNFAYDLAPRLATRFVDDYLQLSNRQAEHALKLFRERHALHARDELPRYYRFLVDIEAAVNDDSIDADDIDAVFDGVERLYTLGVERTIPAAATILAGLNDDQLDALEERLREDIAEDRERMREDHQKRRFEKALEDIEEWLGSVNDTQRELLGTALETMQETRPLWLDWRIARNEKLMALLRERPSEKHIQEFLVGYWIRREGMPEALLKGIDVNRERYRAMIVSLDASLSAEQRAHARARLAEYREMVIDMMPDEVRVAVLESAAGGEQRTLQ